MTFLIVGVIVGLLPTGILTLILLKLLAFHLRQQEKWNQERENLLNRAMSKDLATFVQLQEVQRQSQSNDKPVDGYWAYSDEAELAAAGQAAMAPGFVETFGEIGEE